VKTLSDPDRERVQRRPVDATIEALVALPDSMPWVAQTGEGS